MVLLLQLHISALCRLFKIISSLQLLPLNLLGYKVSSTTCLRLYSITAPTVSVMFVERLIF